MRTRKASLQSSLLVPLGLAAAPLTLIAAPVTWTGGFDKNYATDGNWANSAVPADDLVTDFATFSGAVTANQPILSSGNRSVAGIDFQSPGWFLSGTSILTLGSGGITSAGINTVTANLNTGAGTTFTSNSGYISIRNTGILSGAGQLTIAGSGNVYLDRTSNTYTGGTVITGTATISGVNSLGIGTIILDGGTLKNNLVTFSLAANQGVTLGTGGGTLAVSGSYNFSVAGVIDGASQLIIGANNPSVTAGAVVLTNTSSSTPNSFAGGLLIRGLLRVTNSNGLGAETGIITLDGGILGNNNSDLYTGGRNIFLTANGGTLSSNGSFRRLVVGQNTAGTLFSTISGPGRLTISGVATTFLDFANSYTGGTLVTGTVRPMGNATLGDVTRPVTMNGGTFFPNLETVTYPATRIFILDGAGGTIRPNNGTTTIEGAIEGTGRLNVIGVGTLVLAGTNTYTGGTTVLGGVLVVDGDSLPDVGTLEISNTGTISSGKVQVTGIEQVASLILNYVTQAEGTYGATGSGATNINDSFFTGTGIISVGKAVAPYATWSALFSPADLTDQGGDNDDDGLTNLQEFAYGLNPVDGSSVNPIHVQLDSGTGTFTYQRRKPTGLTYTVQTSSDLEVWTTDDTADQTPTNIAATENESVAVTLTDVPFTGSKLFVRVQAD